LAGQPSFLRGGDTLKKKTRVLQGGPKKRKERKKKTYLWNSYKETVGGGAGIFFWVRRKKVKVGSS